MAFTTTREEVRVVLSREMYADIERALEQPAVTGATTEVQAGYLLGVQRTLAVLRTKYTASK